MGGKKIKLSGKKSKEFKTMMREVLGPRDTKLRFARRQKKCKLPRQKDAEFKKTPKQKGQKRAEKSIKKSAEQKEREVKRAMLKAKLKEVSYC